MSGDGEHLQTDGKLGSDGDSDMSLNKAIEHGKEKRKKYYGSKSFDYSCRNHGGCPCCYGNRTHKYRKAMLKVKDYD